MLEVRVGLGICRIESALEARRRLQRELNLSLEQRFSNLTHAGIAWKAWWCKACWIPFPGVRVKRPREKHGKLHSRRFSGDWCHWVNDHILEIRDGSKAWSQPFWERRLDRIHSFGFCCRITQTSLFYQPDQEPGGRSICPTILLLLQSLSLISFSHHLFVSVLCCYSQWCLFPLHLQRVCYVSTWKLLFYAILCPLIDLLIAFQN